MSLARHVWIAFLRLEFRAMAVLLPVVVGMLWLAVCLELGVWSYGWTGFVPAVSAGFAPAALLGRIAWRGAGEIA